MKGTITKAFLLFVFISLSFLLSLSSKLLSILLIVMYNICVLCSNVVCSIPRLKRDYLELK